MIDEKQKRFTEMASMREASKIPSKFNDNAIGIGERKKKEKYRGNALAI